MATTTPRKPSRLYAAGYLVIPLLGIAVAVLVVDPAQQGLTYAQQLVMTGLLLGVIATATTVWYLLASRAKLRYESTVRSKSLYDELQKLRQLYTRALPIELVMALFLSMDAVRTSVLDRADWGVSNNPTLVDVRTFMLELQRLADTHGAKKLIELAREGKAPFELEVSPPKKLESMKSRLRQSVAVEPV